MTRDEWRREILKKLVDRHETATAVCNALGCSRAWFYSILCGEASPETQSDWQKRINAYLGIEGEPEGEDEKNS